MKINDLVQKTLKPVKLKKNMFVSVSAFCKQYNYPVYFVQKIYKDHIYCIGMHQFIITYDKLPPVNQLYNIQDIPLAVRIQSYFMNFKDEVFTTTDVVNIFKKNRRIINLTLEQFPCVRIICAERYYGNEIALKNLIKLLKKRGVLFEYRDKKLPPIIIKKF